ncbi:Superoxide dismutase [Mn], mitochondrial [Rhizina undulata]
MEGKLNHPLFWENLAPKSAGGGAPPIGALSDAINNVWGNLDNFKKAFNASLAGFHPMKRRSWLGKDKETVHLLIIHQPNQGPIVGKYIPLLGIDV